MSDIIEYFGLDEDDSCLSIAEDNLWLDFDRYFGALDFCANVPKSKKHSLKAGNNSHFQCIRCHMGGPSSQTGNTYCIICRYCSTCSQVVHICPSTSTGNRGSAVEVEMLLPSCALIEDNLSFSDLKSGDITLTDFEKMTQRSACYDDLIRDFISTDKNNSDQKTSSLLLDELSTLSSLELSLFDIARSNTVNGEIEWSRHNAFLNSFLKSNRLGVNNSTDVLSTRGKILRKVIIRALVAVSRCSVAYITNPSSSHTLTKKSKKSKSCNCNQGHTCSISTSIDGAYRAGWICDICRGIGIVGNERWNCMLCRFDACFSCRPRPSVEPGNASGSAATETASGGGGGGGSSSGVNRTTLLEGQLHTSGSTNVATNAKRGIWSIFIKGFNVNNPESYSKSTSSSSISGRWMAPRRDVKHAYKPQISYSSTKVERAPLHGIQLFIQNNDITGTLVFTLPVEEESITIDLELKRKDGSTFVYKLIDRDRDSSIVESSTLLALRQVINYDEELKLTLENETIKFSLQQHSQLTTTVLEPSRKNTVDNQSKGSRGFLGALNLSMTISSLQSLFEESEDSHCVSACRKSSATLLTLHPLMESELSGSWLSKLILKSYRYGSEIAKLKIGDEVEVNHNNTNVWIVGAIALASKESSTSLDSNTSTATSESKDAMNGTLDANKATYDIEYPDGGFEHGVPLGRIRKDKSLSSSKYDGGNNGNMLSNIEEGSALWISVEQLLEFTRNFLGYKDLELHNTASSNEASSVGGSNRSAFINRSESSPFSAFSQLKRQQFVENKDSSLKTPSILENCLSLMLSLAIIRNSLAGVLEVVFILMKQSSRPIVKCQLIYSSLSLLLGSSISKGQNKDNELTTQQTAVLPNKDNQARRRHEESTILIERFFSCSTPQEQAIILMQLVSNLCMVHVSCFPIEHPLELDFLLSFVDECSLNDFNDKHLVDSASSALKLIYVNILVSSKNLSTAEKRQFLDFKVDCGNIDSISASSDATSASSSQVTYRQKLFGLILGIISSGSSELKDSLLTEFSVKLIKLVDIFTLNSSDKIKIIMNLVLKYSDRKSTVSEINLLTELLNDLRGNQILELLMCSNNEDPMNFFFIPFMRLLEKEFKKIVSRCGEKLTQAECLDPLIKRMIEITKTGFIQIFFIKFLDISHAMMDSFDQIKNDSSKNSNPFCLPKVKAGVLYLNSFCDQIFASVETCFQDACAFVAKNIGKEDAITNLRYIISRYHFLPILTILLPSVSFMIESFDFSIKANLNKVEQSVELNDLLENFFMKMQRVKLLLDEVDSKDLFKSEYLKSIVAGNDNIEKAENADFVDKWDITNSDKKLKFESLSCSGLAADRTVVSTTPPPQCVAWAKSANRSLSHLLTFSVRVDTEKIGYNPSYNSSNPELHFIGVALKRKGTKFAPTLPIGPKSLSGLGPSSQIPPGTSFWGLSFYANQIGSSSSSSSTSFYFNNDKVGSATRSLIHGDLVTVICDLSRNSVEITVNLGEFSHIYGNYSMEQSNAKSIHKALKIDTKFSGTGSVSPQGIPTGQTVTNADLSFFSAFVDNAKLTIVPLCMSKAKTGELLYLENISEEINLFSYYVLKYFKAKAITRNKMKIKIGPPEKQREIDIEAWMDCPLFKGGKMYDSRDRPLLLRLLTDAPNGVGDGATLVQIMKRHVSKDQGQVTQINHFVHSVCAALLWHGGLITEAQRLIDNASKRPIPSAHITSVWLEAQALRMSFKSDANRISTPEPKNKANDSSPSSLSSSPDTKVGGRAPINAVYCPKGHELSLFADVAKTTWSCNARSEMAGCRFSISSASVSEDDPVCFSESSEMARWVCVSCNFNYCGLCYESRTSLKKTGRSDSLDSLDIKTQGFDFDRDDCDSDDSDLEFDPAPLLNRLHSLPPEAEGVDELDNDVIQMIRRARFLLEFAPINKTIDKNLDDAVLELIDESIMKNQSSSSSSLGKKNEVTYIEWVISFIRLGPNVDLLKERIVSANFRYSMYSKFLSKSFEMIISCDSFETLDKALDKLLPETDSSNNCGDIGNSTLSVIHDVKSVWLERSKVLMLLTLDAISVSDLDNDRSSKVINFRDILMGELSSSLKYTSRKDLFKQMRWEEVSQIVSKCLQYFVVKYSFDDLVALSSCGFYTFLNILSKTSVLQCRRFSLHMAEYLLSASTLLTNHPNSNPNPASSMTDSQSTRFPTKDYSIFDNILRNYTKLIPKIKSVAGVEDGAKYTRYDGVYICSKMERALSMRLLDADSSPSFTISFWLWPRGVRADGVIFSAGSPELNIPSLDSEFGAVEYANSSITPWSHFCLRFSDGKLQLEIADGSSYRLDGITKLASEQKIFTSRWYLVSVSVDFDSQNISLSVDGTVLDQLVKPANIPQFTANTSLQLFSHPSALAPLRNSFLYFGQRKSPLLHSVPKPLFINYVSSETIIKDIYICDRAISPIDIFKSYLAKEGNSFGYHRSLECEVSSRGTLVSNKVSSRADTDSRRSFFVNVSESDSQSFVAAKILDLSKSSSRCSSSLGYGLVSSSFFYTQFSGNYFPNGIVDFSKNADKRIIGEIALIDGNSDSSSKDYVLLSLNKSKKELTVYVYSDNDLASETIERKPKVFPLPNEIAKWELNSLQFGFTLSAGTTMHIFNATSAVKHLPLEFLATLPKINPSVASNVSLGKSVGTRLFTVNAEQQKIKFVNTDKAPSSGQSIYKTMDESSLHVATIIPGSTLFVSKVESGDWCKIHPYMYSSLDQKIGGSIESEFDVFTEGFIRIKNDNGEILYVQVEESPSGSMTVAQFPILNALEGATTALNVGEAAVRLKVGDKVRLANGSVANGILFGGLIGDIIEDDGSSRPYNVRGPGGETSYYYARDIVKATNPTTTGTTSGGINKFGMFNPPPASFDASFSGGGKKIEVKGSPKSSGSISLKPHASPREGSAEVFPKEISYEPWSNPTCHPHELELSHNGFTIYNGKTYSNENSLSSTITTSIKSLKSCIKIKISSTSFHNDLLSFGVMRIKDHNNNGIPEIMDLETMDEYLSKGFGMFPRSWGISDDRSSSSSGIKIAQCPVAKFVGSDTDIFFHVDEGLPIHLKEGDSIAIESDFSIMPAQLRFSLNDKVLHEFHLTYLAKGTFSFSDFVVGITLPYEFEVKHLSYEDISVSVETFPNQFVKEEEVVANQLAEIAVSNVKDSKIEEEEYSLRFLCEFIYLGSFMSSPEVLSVTSNYEKYYLQDIYSVIGTILRLINDGVVSSAPEDSMLSPANLFSYFWELSFASSSLNIRSYSTNMACRLVQFLEPAQLIKAVENVGIAANLFDITSHSFVFSLFESLGGNLNSISTRENFNVESFTIIDPASRDLLCYQLKSFVQSLMKCGKWERILSDTLKDIFSYSKCVLKELNLATIKSQSCPKRRVIEREHHKCIDLLLAVFDVLSLSSSYQLFPGSSVRSELLLSNVEGNVPTRTYPKDFIVVTEYVNDNIVDSFGEACSALPSDFNPVLEDSRHSLVTCRRTGIDFDVNSDSSKVAAKFIDTNFKLMCQILTSCLNIDCADLQELQAFGFHHVVTPASVGVFKNSELSFDRKISVVKVFESAHPYDIYSKISALEEGNVVELFELPKFKENTSIIVEFDSLSELPLGDVFITFYRDSTLTDFWGRQKYSGKDLPGVRGNPQLIISDCNSKPVVVIHTNSISKAAAKVEKKDGNVVKINSCFGYKFTVYSRPNLAKNAKSPYLSSNSDCNSFFVDQENPRVANLSFLKLRATSFAKQIISNHHELFPSQYSIIDSFIKSCLNNALKTSSVGAVFLSMNQIKNEKFKSALKIDTNEFSALNIDSIVGVDLSESSYLTIGDVNSAVNELSLYPDLRTPHYGECSSSSSAVDNDDDYTIESSGVSSRVFNSILSLLSVGVTTSENEASCNNSSSQNDSLADESQLVSFFNISLPSAPTKALPNGKKPLDSASVEGLKSSGSAIKLLASLPNRGGGSISNSVASISSPIRDVSKKPLFIMMLMPSNRALADSDKDFKMNVLKSLSDTALPGGKSIKVTEVIRVVAVLDSYFKLADDAGYVAIATPANYCWIVTSKTKATHHYLTWYGFRNSTIKSKLKRLLFRFTKEVLIKESSELVFSCLNSFTDEYKNGSLFKEMDYDKLELIFRAAGLGKKSENLDPKGINLLSKLMTCFNTQSPEAFGLNSSPHHTPDPNSGSNFSPSSSSSNAVNTNAVSDFSKYNCLFEHIIGFVIKSIVSHNKLINFSTKPFASFIIESKHNYDLNSDILTKIDIPGARGLEIKFDKLSSMDRRFDYVAIFADEKKTQQLGVKYSGRADSYNNWPGVGKNQSLKIWGISTCFVHFVSTGFHTDWGFKLAAASINAKFSDVANTTSSAVAVVAASAGVESKAPAGKIDGGLRAPLQFGNVAPTSSGFGSAPPGSATISYSIGALIEGNYRNYGTFHRGTISSVNVNGNFNIEYDDGDVESDVPSSRLRPRNGLPVGANSAGGATSNDLHPRYVQATSAQNAIHPPSLGAAGSFGGGSGQVRGSARSSSNPFLNPNTQSNPFIAPSSTLTKAPIQSNDSISSSSNSYEIFNPSDFDICFGPVYGQKPVESFEVNRNGNMSSGYSIYFGLNALKLMLSSQRSCNYLFNSRRGCVMMKLLSSSFTSLMKDNKYFGYNLMGKSLLDIISSIIYCYHNFSITEAYSKVELEKKKIFVSSIERLSSSVIELSKICESKLSSKPTLLNNPNIISLIQASSIIAFFCKQIVSRRSLAFNPVYSSLHPDELFIDSGVNPTFYGSGVMSPSVSGADDARSPAIGERISFGPLFPYLTLPIKLTFSDWEMMSSLTSYSYTHFIKVVGVHGNNVKLGLSLIPLLSNSSKSYNLFQASKDLALSSNIVSYLRNATSINESSNDTHTSSSLGSGNSHTIMTVCSGDIIGISVAVSSSNNYEWKVRFSRNGAAVHEMFESAPLLDSPNKKLSKFYAISSFIQFGENSGGEVIFLESLDVPENMKAATKNNVNLEIVPPVVYTSTFSSLEDDQEEELASGKRDSIVVDTNFQSESLLDYGFSKSTTDISTEVLKSCVVKQLDNDFSLIRSDSQEQQDKYNNAKTSASITDSINSVNDIAVHYAEKWDCNLSDKLLQFFNEDRSVSRPGAVSACPAAISLVNPSSVTSKTALKVKLVSAPFGVNNDFSFGMGSNFPSAGSNFGDSLYSWGVCNCRLNSNKLTKAIDQGVNVKGKDKFRSLRDGDELELVYNSVSHELKITINSAEFSHTFKVPPNLPNLVIGVSLSNDCVVEIVENGTLEKVAPNPRSSGLVVETVDSSVTEPKKALVPSRQSPVVCIGRRKIGSESLIIPHFMTLRQDPDFVINSRMLLFKKLSKLIYSSDSMSSFFDMLIEHGASTTFKNPFSASSASSASSSLSTNNGWQSTSLLKSLNYAYILTKIVRNELDIFFGSSTTDKLSAPNFKFYSVVGPLLISHILPEIMKKRQRTFKFSSGSSSTSSSRSGGGQGDDGADSSEPSTLTFSNNVRGAIGYHVNVDELVTKSSSKRKLIGFKALVTAGYGRESEGSTEADDMKYVSFVPLARTVSSTAANVLSEFKPKFKLVSESSGSIYMEGQILESKQAATTGAPQNITYFEGDMVIRLKPNDELNIGAGSVGIVVSSSAESYKIHWLTNYELSSKEETILDAQCLSNIALYKETEVITLGSSAGTSPSNALTSPNVQGASPLNASASSVTAAFPPFGNNVRKPLKSFEFTQPKTSVAPMATSNTASFPSSSGSISKTRSSIVFGSSKQTFSQSSPQKNGLPIRLAALPTANPASAFATNPKAAEKPMVIPASEYTISAAGGIEGVKNLAENVIESWKSWYHPGVSHSWVIIEFKQPTEIHSFGLCSASDCPDRDPVDIEFQTKLSSIESWYSLQFAPRSYYFTSRLEWTWRNLTVEELNQPESSKATPKPVICTSIRLLINSNRSGKAEDGVQLRHFCIKGIIPSATTTAASAPTAIATATTSAVPASAGRRILVGKSSTSLMCLTSPLFCSRAKFTFVPIYSEIDDKSATQSTNDDSTSGKVDESLSYSVTVTPLINPLDILSEKEFYRDVSEFEDNFFDDFYNKKPPPNSSLGKTEAEATPKLSSSAKMNEVHCTFDRIGDENGALYFIGTKGRTATYTNPHTSGEVFASISSSTHSLGSAEAFVDRITTSKSTNFTSNEENSWMKVDLGQHRLLLPNYYSFRSGSGSNKIRNWRLEGSVDDINWVSLREHHNDVTMSADCSRASWPIVTSPSSFRYFRILQTGRGSDHNYYLEVIGLELYGTLGSFRLLNAETTVPTSISMGNATNSSSAAGGGPTPSTSSSEGAPSASTSTFKLSKKISSLNSLIRQVDADLIHYIDDLKITDATLFSQTWEQIAPSAGFKDKFPILKGHLNPKSNLFLSLRFRYIQLLNEKFKSCFTSVDLAFLTSRETDSRSENIFAIISKARGYLLNCVKSNFVDKLISESESPGEGRLRVQVSRSRSLKYRHKGEKDDEGVWTVFGQIFRQLNKSHPKLFRQGQSGSKLWDTVLQGEFAADAGGPYRESWSQMMDDLKSDYMPLLLTSPNLEDKDEKAVRKEAYIVNPSCANSEIQLEMLVFVGKLFGHAMRANLCLDIVLAPLVWKLIIDDDVMLDDLITVDYFNYNRIKFLRSKKFERDHYMDETFTSRSYSGKEVDLIPGGSKISLVEDIDKYCCLLEQFKLYEMKSVCTAIRRGIDTVIPPAATSIMSWHQLEEKVCGAPTIDCKLLKSCTIYRNFSSTDKLIVWFWEIFEKDFTDDERRAFIRFAWGRSRIPSKGGFEFKITKMVHRNADSYLPESHTCFFTVDFPEYSTKEVLHKKLLYACHNCTAIDGDGGGTGTYED